MRRRVLAIVALVASTAAAAAVEEKLVFETDSLYHHIIVSETSTTRILRFHRGSAQSALGLDFAQSAILLADPYSLHMNYARYAMAAAALVENPRRALFVGLGAGSLPKFFARAYPDCKVDVAELDGKVVEVARKYFFFPDLANLTVTVMDGRQFVRKTDNKYDMVFLDAYRDDMIPFHLMTSEFFEELKGKLSPGGVVVSNIAIQYEAQLYPWVLRTYQNAFETLLEASIPNTINRVLICEPRLEGDKPADFVAKAGTLSTKVQFGYDLAACAAIFKDRSSKQSSKNVLSDDFAPVNLMRIRKADEKDWEY